MIEAEYTGANNSLVCMPGVNDFTQVEYVNDSSVSVLWTGPDVTYYLETAMDPLTGMYFYMFSGIAIAVFHCTSTFHKN